ncbi:MAG: hypothetical protein DMF46_02630 [Verrucomicrobia bacterium]|nr:MAG: hypothetical protein DMF46_02630 [Verrucomicrobiota bacterium]
MRVIVWGINYAPEITGIAPHNVALCEFLQRRGHDVEMVTTFSYYPAWRKRAEDRRRFFRTDRINGVQVHRCWHFVPGRVSAWKRIVHEATFVLTSTMRILLLRRPDVYVVVSPPLLLGAAGWVVATLKRAPFIFHVQDLCKICNRTRRLVWACCEQVCLRALCIGSKRLLTNTPHASPGSAGKLSMYFVAKACRTAG